MRYWKCTCCSTLLVTQKLESKDYCRPTCPIEACESSSYQEISLAEFKTIALAADDPTIKKTELSVVSMTTIPAMPNFYGIDTTWGENGHVDGYIKFPIIAWNIINRSDAECDEVITSKTPICATAYDMDLLDILNPDGTITVIYEYEDHIFTDINDWLTYRKEQRIEGIKWLNEREEKRMLEEKAKQTPKNWRERTYEQGVEAKSNYLNLSDNPHADNRTAYILWRQGYMGEAFIPLEPIKPNTI